MELFTPQEKSETEAAMIADGVHLQALPLERLGYYGCREKRLPVAVGNCFLEGEDGYDDDFYEDEAYKNVGPQRGTAENSDPVHAHSLLGSSTKPAQQ